MKILKILETVKNFIKKNKKLVTVVSAMFCAVVLVAGSIAGTIAYLTSQQTITNTFTVGNVTITMDETDVDEYGVAVNPAARADTNEYKLIPGHEYVKDPTIHVDANSESCYLFVKVENGLDAIDGDSIPTSLAANGWEQIGTSNVWYFNNKTTDNAADDIVTKGTSKVTFSEFSIIESADVAAYKDAKIVVTGYAVQSDGFTSAEAAWTATFGAPVNP